MLVRPPKGVAGQRYLTAPDRRARHHADPAVALASLSCPPFSRRARTERGGTIAGSVGTVGRNSNAPKTEGELEMTAEMKGREGVKKATRLGTYSVLRTIWGCFVKAPQSGKERRVVGKGPLEDGE